jgi:hypothetical protein
VAQIHRGSNTTLRTIVDFRRCVGVGLLHP